MRLWASSHIALLATAASVLLNPSDPEWKKPAPVQFVVRMETSRGVIRVGATRAWAPLGADRFYNLVRNGYYDEARFFRVVAGRWAQFGIHADPKIAKVWRNEMLADDPRVESNVRGAVAFAWAVRNGRSTQVFISLGENAATLDAQGFAPFGRVTEGMDVADRLYAEYDEAVGGIRAGRQDVVFEMGNAYLMKEYPRLDFIRRAVIEEP